MTNDDFSVEKNGSTMMQSLPNPSLLDFFPGFWKFLLALTARILTYIFYNLSLSRIHGLSLSFCGTLYLRPQKVFCIRELNKLNLTVDH